MKAYADYEQLTGGVETLFAKTTQSYSEMVTEGTKAGKSIEEVNKAWVESQSSIDTVMENASNAYKTAGLSANEYMETVTSFSASLLQSVGGDTDKAAQMADQAIVDMSDNANKMGSDMSMIQNAYNGFAKQNYTMLDNLKLGYGGTKEEMARLLEDASKISGVKYDIKSYADVTQAIHVMQESMGIAGTTAKEASTTISGSLNMAKSAWSNLLVGMADEEADFDTLVDNFVESVGMAAENILPRVEVAISGVGSLIEELLPVIIDEIPVIINDILPDLIESGVCMINSLITGLQNNLPVLVEGAFQIITTLANGILEMLPSIVELGLQLILSLATGLIEYLPGMIPTVIDVVMTIGQMLIDNLPLIITAGIQLLLALGLGFIEALPELIEQLPTLIEGIVTGLVDNIDLLIDCGIELFMALIANLPEIIVGLCKAVPKIITSLINAFAKLYDKFTEVGSNIVQGIWNGIQAGWNWLTGKVRELAEGLLNAAKDALGIHSPSVKFKYLGEMCVAGFDNGISDLMSGDYLAKTVSATMGTLQANFTGGVVGNTGNSNTQTFNFYDTQVTPDAIRRSFDNTMTFGLAGGI